MEIAESIAMAAVNIELESCWFCKEERPEVENKTDENPPTEDNDDEDSPPENDVINASSTLGEKLGNCPNWDIVKPWSETSTAIVPGAHHLIPGNASLKKAMNNGLKHFMCKKGNYNLISDIGYDVNDAANGVWLPANYNVRPGKEDYKKKWSEYSEDFKDEYAVRAMRTADAQFHDAHPDYNAKVLATLERIKENIIIFGEGKCPICGEPNHDKTRPPYGLVSRLNFVSQQHRQILKGLSYKSSRKLTMIQNGYHTSSRVVRYFGIKESTP
jgi:hypothetical protein